MTLIITEKEYGRNLTTQQLAILKKVQYDSPYDPGFFGNRGDGDSSNSETPTEQAGSHHYVVEKKKRKETVKATKNPTLQPKSIAGMKFFGEAPGFKTSMNEIVHKIVAIFNTQQGGGGLNAFNFGNLPTFGGSNSLQDIVSKVLTNGSVIDSASPLFSQVQNMAQQVSGILGGKATDSIDMRHPDSMMQFMMGASAVFSGSTQSPFSIDTLHEGVMLASDVQQFLQKTVGGPIYNSLITDFSGFNSSINTSLGGLVTVTDAHNVLDLLSSSSVQASIGDANTVLSLIQRATNIISAGNIGISTGIEVVTGIQVLSSGQDYSNTDTIVIEGGTVECRASLVTDGSGGIATVTITNPGFGFTTANNAELFVVSTYGHAANLTFTLSDNANIPQAPPASPPSQGDGLNNLAGELKSIMGLVQGAMKQADSDKAKSKLSSSKEPKTPFQGKHPQEDKKTNLPFEEDTNYEGQEDSKTATA